jgi:RimJ/RimL family protein N-acetyltransferase
MLILRAPIPYDLPPIYALAMDEKDKFLDDYQVFDLDYAKELIASPHARIIDDHGYAAGIVWFDETRDDLHTQMHVLVKPEYWKQVIQLDLLPQAADWCFDTMNVAKILAEPMSTQKGAIKLLRKYKFYEHKPFYKHTKQKGVIVDVIPFELRKNYWRKLRDVRKEHRLPG